jgi:hypothetical protein
MLDNLPSEVAHCVKCIIPEWDAVSSDEDAHRSDDEAISSSTEDSSLAIYCAYLDNDKVGFLSSHCLTCKESIIPEHLPIDQVIRFLRKVFDKYDIII